MSGVTRWCAFFLANALWQGMLLTGAVAILVRSVRTLGPKLQYRLWVTCLLASVGLPTLATILALVPVRDTNTVAVVSSDRWLTPRPPEHGRFNMHLTAIPANAPAWNIYALVTAVFAASLLAGTILLVLRLRRTQSLMQLSVGDAHLDSLHLLPPGSKNVGVLVCPALTVPMTVSFRKHLILLPPSFHAMSREELRCSMAHELAHVHRQDFRVNVALEVLSLAVCLSPSTAWIKRQIAECREAVCDEIAAKTTVGRTQYARSLLTIARRTQGQSLAGLALGISNTALERRITALLNPVRNSPRKNFTLSLLSAVTVLGVSALAVCCSLHPTSVQAAGMPAFSYDPSQTFDKLTPQAQRKRAPDFTLVDNNGKTITLSAYKGKVVLLDFWATWCGGCKLEIPWYMEFDRKYRKDGLAVVGVSMDEKGWDAVRPFLAKKRDAETGGMIAMQYPIVIGNDALGQRFGLTSMPMTLLIDRDGRVAVSHTGVVDKDNFESNLRALLK